MYAEKGFETTQPTIHADYLELPVLLRLDSAPVTRSPLVFHAVAGVAPSVRARCEVFANTAMGFRRERCDNRDHFDDEHSPARVEVGFVRGAGVGLSVFRFTAGFEWRLVTSMTDIGVWRGEPSRNRASYTIFRLSYGLGGSE